MNRWCPWLLVMVVIGGIAGARDVTAQAVPEPADSRTEQRVLDRINKIRADHGLARLTKDERLNEVARDHSCRMARDDVLGHTSRTGETLRDRVRAAGRDYAAAGENLAKTVKARSPVDRAVQGWMKSEGHRKNILSPEFTVTGVGICHRETAYYFTQIFLRPR